MEIALYQSKTGGILDKAINVFSGRDGYSHVEFVFSDGMFFSSSGLDGGVRFKKIVPDPTHWRFFDLDLTIEDEAALRAWCDTQDGKEYDYLGVIDFVFPTHHNQNCWFCSEIVVAGLQHIQIFTRLQPWKISPNDLFLILTAIENTILVEGNPPARIAERTSLMPGRNRCLSSNWKMI